MSPKALIRNILRAGLGNVQDNQARARAAFLNMPAAAMDKPYGTSDQTPRSILTAYEKQEQDLLAAIKWVEGRE